MSIIDEINEGINPDWDGGWERFRAVKVEDGFIEGTMTITYEIPKDQVFILNIKRPYPWEKVSTCTALEKSEVK